MDSDQPIAYHIETWADAVPACSKTPLAPVAGEFDLVSSQVRSAHHRKGAWDAPYKE